MKITKRKGARLKKKKQAVKEGPKRITVWGVRLFKVMGVGLAFGLIFIGAQAGFGKAKSLQYFNITKIALSGRDAVDENSVMNLIGPVLGENIFLFDLQSIGKNLEAHPWIKSVEVRRELPNTLRIKVEERIPVVIADMKYLWLMDEQGVALSRLKKGERATLPVITGLKIDTSKVKPGFRVDMKKLRPALMAMEQLKGYKLFGKAKMTLIDLKDPSALKISFAGTRVSLIAPKWRWNDEVDRLRVVDFILRKKQGDITSIDVTYINKVIVTYPKA